MKKTKLISYLNAREETITDTLNKLFKKHSESNFKLNMYNYFLKGTYVNYFPPYPVMVYNLKNSLKMNTFLEDFFNSLIDKLQWLQDNFYNESNECTQKQLNEARTLLQKLIQEESILQTETQEKIEYFLGIKKALLCIQKKVISFNFNFNSLKIELKPDVEDYVHLMKDIEMNEYMCGRIYETKLFYQKLEGE